MLSTRTGVASEGEAQVPTRVRKGNGKALIDRGFRGATAVGAICVGVVVLGIGAMLLQGALPALERFGLPFVWTESWNPVAEEFGALGPLVGTCLCATLALVVAVPLALGVAMFLTELAPRWLAGPAGLVLELMAAIPSIIYGMWGLFVLAPVMADHVQPALASTLGFLPLFQGAPMGIGLLTAALVLALMVVPYVAAVARDLFAMVPVTTKEAAYGLGATRWEVFRAVVLPHTKAGIAGGVILGFGRALGETMAVTFVIGNSHRLSASLFAPSNTIASTLANEFTEATGELHTASLMALGLVLFLLTFTVLGVGRLLVGRQALARRPA